MARFFEDKFKWAEIVASTKQVTLAIEDNTVSTVAGICNLRGRTSRDTSSMMELAAARDIEGEVTVVLPTSVLYLFSNQPPPHNLTSSSEGAATSSLLFMRGTQGEYVGQLSLWARSFLHVDASKIVQFLRNVVTNAVKVLHCGCIYIHNFSCLGNIQTGPPCRSTTLLSAGRFPSSWITVRPTFLLLPLMGCVLTL